MDKTLDEMISTRPKTARRTSAVRKGAAAKAQVLGKAAPGPVQKARAAAANAKPAAPLSEKIVVSNLPADVNEQQLKELFTTTIGPLRDVTLTYDHNGRSKGVATILFQRKGDGSKAYAQYHNRLIDGKRPMKIEIIVDPSRVPVTPLAARVAPALATVAAAGGAPAGARTAGRGRPGRGRGGGRRKNERPQKTVADLDAEMEDYTATAAPAAAAVPVTGA